MSKIWSKIVTIIVIVLFIVGFQSLILTDQAVSDAFEGLMGTLPFAEPFSKIVCNVLGYQNGHPLVSTSGFIKDIAKLMVMACIQPALTAVFMFLFLKFPSTVASIDERESYMNGIGYRIKEFIIHIITAPFCAVFAGWIMSWILDWSKTKFGLLGSMLTGLLSIILATGLSAIPMIILGTSISVALLWRLLVTMLGGMLTALTTTLFSIAMYYAFLNGIPSHMVGSVVGLIASLIVLDIIIQCFQRALGISSIN